MKTGRNPFVPVDRETVINSLRAIGSHDPDVLRARKLSMIRSFRSLKLVGAALVPVGVAVALVLGQMVGGVALVLMGAWVWLRGARNAAVVEAGYSEFVKSPVTGQ